MAQINQPVLQVRALDTQLKVRVTYTARFSRLDRHMAANGLKWVERIDILEVDGTDETFIDKFPQNTIPVEDGDGFLDVSREREVTLLRSDLQAELSRGDEIRCRIKLVPSGMPAESNAATNSVGG
jgi:hypothetical protein